MLHAFAAYLDAQLPPDAPQAAAAFSARHVSAAPAAAPRGPHALALHRVARSPPHYVLVRGDETIEVRRFTDDSRGLVVRAPDYRSRMINDFANIEHCIIRSRGIIVPFLSDITSKMIDLTL